ncbi:MAG: transglycosylase SLT domain-containing protein [Actinomycetota bacterium]|nr:transglycosylase SLT domain-containing protein [Actinomycetota bacterium]
MKGSRVALGVGGLAAGAVLAIPIAAIVLLGSVFGGLGTPPPSPLPAPTGPSATGQPPSSIVALDEAVTTSTPPMEPCSVPAALLLGQQEAESGWTSTAVSPAGAEGLSQFEPGTFTAYDAPSPPGGVVPPTPFDPVDAAYAEARMLCSDGVLTNLAAALTIYNCGSNSPVCQGLAAGYVMSVEGYASAIAGNLNLPGGGL